MVRSLLSASLAAVLFAFDCQAASPNACKSRDIASAVRAIFAAKCTECHGADLAQPEGRFGYVLDLARIAGNPEMVIPSSPGESELWELVRRGEMPPAGASAGPLSGQEKETIRSWIAAGAPAPAVPLPMAPAPTPTTRNRSCHREPGHGGTRHCR